MIILDLLPPKFQGLVGIVIYPDPRFSRAFGPGSTGANLPKLRDLNRIPIKQHPSCFLNQANAGV
jgi:hypothetical protein